MSQLFFLYYIEAVRPLELLLPRPIMAVLLFVIFFWGGESNGRDAMSLSVTIQLQPPAVP